MGRGSKIYRRFGLKWALAYRFKKIKRKIKQNTPLFLQKALMFFRILKLKNTNKLTIYRILIQCHCIIEKQEHLEFVAEHYEKINSWLNSQEFKTKYIKTNHPYPSLLNPDRLTKDSKNSYTDLSYETIPAEIGWDLNLPLPPYYRFVYWGSHGCGNTGLATFLRYCGIFECYYEPRIIEVREIYKRYFNRILIFDSKGKCNYLAIRNFIQKREGDKFYALVPITFKSCSLNLLRDSISSLKTYMGMKRLGKAKREITLHSDINEVCENLVRYEGDSRVPSLDRIKKWINHRYLCFHDTQLKNALFNLKDSIIIDMSEIVGEKTFDTIKRLSKELGFQAPKEKYREKFKENIAKYSTLLPLTLVVQSQKHKLNLYILDSVHRIEDNVYLTNVAATIIHEIKHCLDITKDLFHQPYFYDGIIVCAKEEDWEALKQDSKTMQEVKDYLLKFIKRLQEQKEIEDKKKITESQILEYFKERKDLRVRFKKVLDEHLAYIKSVRPDIVKSWKYYQEFERMCEELD